MQSLNTFATRRELCPGESRGEYYAITQIEGAETLPLSHKILLENLLRHEDGTLVTRDQILALVQWNPSRLSEDEIQFVPSRVIMQDFTGVPCVVDLATMREAAEAMGADARMVEPRTRADLIIDHSVLTENMGSRDSLEKNIAAEFGRNRERYDFLRWGQSTFGSFHIMPPDAGIIHQINLEHLAQVVLAKDGLVYPDSCVGLDSHTTMVNGLSVLGWGVGGIEAEAAMLGQPVAMLIPRVIGVHLTGTLPSGVLATDLALQLTQLLRAHGVVGAIVEFYGPAVASLGVEDRATVSNVSPEFGSTACMWPIDEATLSYLKNSRRSDDHFELVRKYAHAQSLWPDPGRNTRYSETLEFDLSTVQSSIAGPSKPQDRIELPDVKTTVEKLLGEGHAGEPDREELSPGSVVIAGITSCTNTSNPYAMIAAGLLARNASRRGLKPPAYVKTSLAPGSRVVTAYLQRAGLIEPLESLGFHVVAYGCATCIGNVGELKPGIAERITDDLIPVAAVLSGNRNFENRISPYAKMNFLASPLLVIAYALAGTVNIDIQHDPLGDGAAGRPVYLHEIWPSDEEIRKIVQTCVNGELFTDTYREAEKGGVEWQRLAKSTPTSFSWDPESTYVRRPPYFDDIKPVPAPIGDIESARVLVSLGDSVTTDHISPAGVIKPGTPAADYLEQHGVGPDQYNSYGSRRGNHEVMMRGGFSNPKLRNLLLGG